MSVLRQSWAALRALLVLTVVLGIAYPLLVTGVARAMPGRADGSIVHAQGREVGSSLIGQPTSDVTWFAARPSAVDAPGAESGGSNLGQNADEQKKAIAALEGKEVAGRPIAVKIAVNTQEAEEELKGAKDEAAAATEPESVVVAS